MSGRYKLSWLCEALMVSRSGYYDWLTRRANPGPRARENAILKQQIRTEFERSRRTYGSPRITRTLGGRVSRQRVARLMKQERLKARWISKFKVPTTDSRHADPIAPNRLPGVEVKRLNQVWVTDATAILTGQGWLYLVAVLDLHSRRIVGWSMDQYLDAKLTITALEMALAGRQPAPGLIVHSDRGSQFASRDYRAALASCGLVASMSRKGNCYDNAFIESFWSSLKYEVVYHRRFASRAEARTAVFDYIETFYNRARLHSSLGYVSPTTFESQLNQN
jgi:transposase InsO family protein